MFAKVNATVVLHLLWQITISKISKIFFFLLPDADPARINRCQAINTWKI